MFFSCLNLFLILSINLWPFGTGRPGAEIKKSAYELPSGQELQKFETVKISLGTFSEASISTTGTFQVFDKDNRSLFGGIKMAPTKVSAGEDGVRIGPETFKNSPVLIRTEGALHLGAKSYRRSLRLWKEGGRVLIVNEISLEDYLKGVLPLEASASWPMESLKAQAVASRTYALFKAIEKKDEKFAMTQDVLSQVYGGKGSESPETTRAVNETRGEVLITDGKIFPAYFHSTCGGKTTQAEYVWDVEPHPSLRGGDCNFCWSSKHYRWRQEFSRDEILRRLKLKGVKMGTIRDIQVGEMDKSGRARSFIVIHDEGQIKFHSNDFRIWMDAGKFKSTYITAISKTSNGFLFEGKGWGHGVGMCQFGMRQLAKLGYTHQQILEYYYPRSKIKVLPEIAAGGEQPVTTASLLQKIKENFV